MLTAAKRVAFGAGVLKADHKDHQGKRKNDHKGYGDKSTSGILPSIVETMDCSDEQGEKEDQPQRAQRAQRG